jgi:DNA-binding CsgD family transcriptional regulator
MAKAADILETVDLLYRAAVEPELWRDALHQFALTTGGVGTAMIPITPGNIAGLIVSPELDESNIEYSREWWQYDTRVLRIYSRKLNDGVCCEAELFTDEELARDPLRQEFLKSYGIGAFAAQLVAPMPNFVVAFSVQRALKRGQFEKQDLETLKLLGTHAARALLISSHLSSARNVEQTLSAALARLDCGAFVVNQSLQVVFANDAASRLIGDGLLLSRGQLKAQSAEHQVLLARLLQSTLTLEGEPADLETVALPRASGRRPLLIQAIPISPNSTDCGGLSNAAALIIVVDPEQRRRVSPIKALRLLGLTASEARLAALIGAGHARAAAAEVLGISETTASDTIKQVYSKLDISRQSQLVHLIDGLAVLRPEGEPGDGS